MTSLPKPAMFNLVHILTGMRRSGKTFQLFQLINDLMQSGVPREHMWPFAVWCGWVCQVVTVLRSSLPQVR